MVKKANGIARATAASAGAGAGASARPSKANLSTPGSIKTSKFKKWKAKANREKAATAAAAIEEVISVGVGTGDGDATVAEASTMTPALKLATNAEGSVPAPTTAIAEASASAAKPKPKPKPKLAVVDDATATKKDKGIAIVNGGGDGRMRNRKERVRRRALKGMGKEMAEDGGMKGKVKKTLGKMEERGACEGAGFIFMCNAQTKKECYQNRLFGLPSGKIGRVQKIRPGAKLFLYDFDLKLLYGVYKAASNGGMNLVPKAFRGKFPAQVKFKIDKDCLPLAESSFKEAIKENYSGKSKFDPELNARQVQRLIALFKPANAPQSAKNRLEERHYYEDRRRPYHFEEMRPSFPVEVREQWFDEERHAAVIHDPCEYPYRAPRFATLPVESRLGHGDHHIYHRPAHVAPEPRHIPLVVDSHHAPLAIERHHVPSVPEPRRVSPGYYHTLASSDDSYYRSMVDLAPERYTDRAVGEITARDPIIPRDHTRLPGEVSAHTGRLEELYQTGGIVSRGAQLEELYRPGEVMARADHAAIATRADRLDEPYRFDHHVTHAVDLPRHSAYPTAIYETNPAYAETSQRHISARANAPGAPVSSLYSFAGGPAYR